MTFSKVSIRVPATTANLGPGFDSLSLALDLWNESTISFSESKTQVNVHGEGEGCLPLDETNLIARVAIQFLRENGFNKNVTLQVVCHNQIPLGSGMGSSAAAVLTGLLGANILAGSPLDDRQILLKAAEIEGHADNAAAALLGGLVVVINGGDQLITKKFELNDLPVLIILPAFHFPTSMARSVLPATISHNDAVFNIGRAVLVVDALRNVEYSLLPKIMDDRLHQPYRLKIIPGAIEAMQKVQKACHCSMCLSGAGPSLVGFMAESERPTAADIAVQEFNKVGITSRTFFLQSTNNGASIRVFS